MIQTNLKKEDGAIDKWMIVSICAILLFVGVAAFAVWSFVNYTDQKTNVDAKIDSAVAVAKKTQADSDEAKFTEREKQPNRQFVGPDDYGRVTFDYPKTWSAYISKDATSGGTYEAYFNPLSVPPITSSGIYALRVTIQQTDYDSAVSKFDSLVKKGSLDSSSITVDGSTGARFDGSFSTNLRGSLVMFKIRDKVLTIRTDAITFTGDFNAVVGSIKFNQ